MLPFMVGAVIPAARPLRLGRGSRCGATLTKQVAGATLLPPPRARLGSQVTIRRDRTGSARAARLPPGISSRSVLAALLFGWDTGSGS
jgi:hypothetical protein